jgi:hypothetical protein
VVSARPGFIVKTRQQPSEDAANTTLTPGGPALGAAGGPDASSVADKVQLRSEIDSAKYPNADRSILSIPTILETFAPRG